MDRTFGVGVNTAGNRQSLSPNTYLSPIALFPHRRTVSDVGVNHFYDHDSGAQEDDLNTIGCNSVSPYSPSAKSFTVASPRSQNDKRIQPAQPGQPFDMVIFKNCLHPLDYDHAGSEASSLGLGMKFKKNSDVSQYAFYSDRGRHVTSTKPSARRYSRSFVVSNIDKTNSLTLIAL